jgi:GNAT superfamily N-acetyltransferase
MPIDIVIRAARPGEREALESLQRRASAANPGDRDALLAHPDAIAIPAGQIAAGRVVVAEGRGVCAGFAAILPRADGDVELDGLFVEPGWWKRGIGRALVEHCCGLALGMGAQHLHVVGNPHALGFYGKCGFETVGLKRMRFGSGVVMRRRL